MTRDIAGLIIFALISFGIPLAIFLAFRWQKKKSAEIQQRLIRSGFSVDRFFFHDKEFLAIDVRQKKIAIGHHTSHEPTLINFSDVLEWRTHLGGPGSSDTSSYVEIVTNNIKHPTYKVTLSGKDAVKECFDVLSAAFKGGYVPDDSSTAGANPSASQQQSKTKALRWGLLFLLLFIVGSCTGSCVATA